MYGTGTRSYWYSTMVVVLVAWTRKGGVGFKKQASGKQQWWWLSLDTQGGNWVTRGVHILPTDVTGNYRYFSTHQGPRPRVADKHKLAVSTRSGK